MKKVIGVVLLLCGFVFSNMVFADTFRLPDIEGQQIEMTTDQITLGIESLVLIPGFVEVEISPGDMIVNFANIYNQIEIEIKELNFLYPYLDRNKNTYNKKCNNSLSFRNTLIDAKKYTRDGVEKIHKRGCLVLFSIQG